MNREVVTREIQKIKIEAAEMSAHIYKPEWSRIETAGIASMIAAIYSGCESIFMNLCKNKVQKKEHWHKELLKNAIAEGLVPPETEEILGDMLAFRHIQRNYYVHELIESEVRQKAVEVVNIIVPALDKHLQKFLEKHSKDKDIPT